MSLTNRLALSAGAIGCAVAAGCGSQPEITSTTAITTSYLTPGDHLVRASMALRGKRPSIADLEAVDGDPDKLSGIVDGYLAGPELARAMRELHDEALLAVPDFFIFPAGFQPNGPLADVDVASLNRSIMEAPLRLIEHVIANDRPYTEIVTADYTLVDRVVSNVWGGLDKKVTGDGWEVARWVDGRTNAGVLSDPWLFTRHSSTLSNANRGRANAISRALLCYDFLSRDVVIDASIDLANPDAVSDAVAKNEACASCHQALDPLATFFDGFAPIYVPATATFPFDTFHPKTFEILGVKMRPASYFGEEGKTLADLGRKIAADPRFSLCAAKRFYGYFNQVPLDDVPFDEASKLQSAFIDSGYSAKALAKAIVLSDAFRTSHTSGVAPAATLVGVRKARPWELASAVEDITGFEWTVDMTPAKLGKIDIATDSFVGFRVLAGGTDSYYVLRESPAYNATSHLFLQRLAEGAANHAVAVDYAEQDASKRRLLGAAADDGADEESTRAVIADLHARIFGRLDDPRSPEVDETYALFTGAIERGSTREGAWKLTLAAMLEDFRMAYY